MKLIKRDDAERIVSAEVLIPEILNSYGDYHTKKSVKDFAYGFMRSGFKIDVNHDNKPVKAHVVESFIANDSDPTFIPGSWVVTMHIPDDVVWDKIVRNELTGYSYEALVQVLPVSTEVNYAKIISGTTNISEDHSHDFIIIVDRNTISGGTSAFESHTHNINRFCFTDNSLDHCHLFNHVHLLST